MKKIFVSDDSLLMGEWNWERNTRLGYSPYSIPCGSAQKVWWKCSKGHEWEARINNRAHGNNCPICIGKKTLQGYNDLASINPSLAAEWHPTKNGDLTPQDVTAYSNKKVWWKCNNGHEWEATISHRSSGRGCPICYGEHKTSFPEQAIFFYLNRLTTAYNRYKFNSNMEIDIFLPELMIGIEYDGDYFHSGKRSLDRDTRKENLAREMGILLIRVKEVIGDYKEEYANNTIYVKVNTFALLAESIKKLIDYINGISRLSWEADIDIDRDRIAIYNQYVTGDKKRSLAVQNPKLASEWHPTKNGNIRPSHVTVNSNKKVWWLCENGHEWEAVINSRNQGAGCPYCSGLKAIVGYNDLETVNPRLALQWHPSKNGKLTPQNITANSNKKVWWQCEKGHEWETTVYDRNKGNGCPVCSGHKALSGYNDLATVNPKLASEWHPTKNGKLTACDVTTGSDKKVWWKCSKGHEWEATISSRSMGCGCPYCAGQKLIIGFNDLQTVNPLLASEWHPIKNGNKTPTDVIPGSNKKVWWLGKCGHEWEAVISSRSAGRGCPYCASQKLLVGFNDLATRNPKLASEWHPTKNGSLTPKDVMPGTNKKVWWLCEKGHEWENSINVRNGGNGCPYCANQIVLKGYNDLATLNPKLALQWHYAKNGDLTPSDVMPGSNKKVWWICECGHEWEAMVNSRNKGHGCPKCAIKRRSEARRKKKTKN